jgi:putative SOS response-associated peptidase YedK
LLPQLDPEHFSFEEPPRYNIAPTQSIVCILRESTGRTLVQDPKWTGQPRTPIKARWGLVPSWAKDLAIGNRMINARSETVDSKPSFRKAFASRRCLIPADGYYEWKKVSDGKQPFLIEPKDGGILAMAGLWEENSRIAEDGTPIRTCTILTSEANQTTSVVHDRMPVLLSQRDHEQWLDPGFRDTEELKALLAPAPEDLLQMTPVSRHVNSPKNDDEECVAAVDL